MKKEDYDEIAQAIRWAYKEDRAEELVDVIDGYDSRDKRDTEAKSDQERGFAHGQSGPYASAVRQGVEESASRNCSTCRHYDDRGKMWPRRCDACQDTVRLLRGYEPDSISAPTLARAALAKEPR